MTDFDPKVLIGFIIGSLASVGLIGFLFFQTNQIAVDKVVLVEAGLAHYNNKGEFILTIPAKKEDK